MSSHNVSVFDVLANQRHPYEGLGTTLADSKERTEIFFCMTTDASDRLWQGFRINFSEPETVPRQIDNAIREMWADGWDPNSNFNLFSRDFGLALATSIIQHLGGKIIFRSESELDHLSIWWVEQSVEVFPFHRIIKTLESPFEESASSFFVGIADLLQAAKCSTPSKKL